MDKKVSVWKASLMYGAILGVVWIIYMLLRYYGLTINYIYSVIQIALLAYLLKSYRNNYCSGNITYGQSVGAGIIIFFYYTIILCIFKYLLFEVIYTGFIDKEIAIYEQSLIKQGKPQETIDSFLVLHRQSLNPSVRNTIMDVLVNMFYGTVISLVVSIFIKKEVNPLIDVPNNQQI